MIHKQTFLIVFSIIGLCNVNPINAQDDTKRQFLGIQGPIGLSENLFSRASIDFIFAARYGYKINPKISFGPEISGVAASHLLDNNDDKSFRLMFGGFSRYTILPTKRINLFIEVSPYVMYIRYIPGSDLIFDNIPEKRELHFTGYLGPGITINTKNRTVSLDLMYKSSPDYFVNSKKSVFSYRLNFHF